MTLHFFTQSNPGGGWSEVDLDTVEIHQLTHRVSYSTPAELSFKVLAPEHEFPFTPKAPIIFYDDASYTFDAPNFEGFVAEMSPAMNNVVQVTCFDNTKRMTEEIVIMSAPWQEGDFGDGEPPTEGVGALPRLVMNVTIDNDDDFAFARTTTSQSTGDPAGIPVTVGNNLSVGDMIKIILDDAFEPMLWINGANADGLSYTFAELAQMAYQPQEKQVFESESIRSGLDRLLTQQPTVRYVWLPGPDKRKFKFVDARDSPSVTLTLNDFAGVSHPVLSMQMRRITDHVKTAVKFYGPETTVTQTVSTADLSSPAIGQWNQTVFGDLNAYDPVLLEDYGDGVTVAYRKYQIADPDKRRSANLLGVDYIAGAGRYNFFQTRTPTLEVSFDGARTWMSIWGWKFDSFNGIIDLGENYIYFWRSRPAEGSTRHFFTPSHVRFTHSYYTNPITVRWPASSFVGTGFDVAGIQDTMRVYDEMLAVGFERGTAVTTASRVAQFKELARRLSEMYRDISYVGGATLEGIDYRFLRLNKKVNIASVDQDGNAITTGWESVGAIVSEVEYDFDQNPTTISFSHDLADYIGWSIDQLKAILKIEAMRSVTLITSGPINFRDPVFYDTFYYSPRTGVLEEGVVGNF